LAAFPEEFGEFGWGVVPETTGGDLVGAVAGVVMALSAHPDVDPAASGERASIGPSRERCGNRVFLGNDQPLGVGRGLVAVVLAGRGLIAEAELQAAAGGLQSGVIQRTLQLRRVLAQYRKRFCLFHRQVRRHLPVAIDVDSNIDAAELGRIEADFEPALATLN